MEIQPDESVVVSIPASPANHSEQSAATISIRKLWSTVTSTVAEIWPNIIPVVSILSSILLIIVVVSIAVQPILSSWDWKQYSWEQWIVLGTVAVPYIYYIIILIIAPTISIRKLWSTVTSTVAEIWTNIIPVASILSSILLIIVVVSIAIQPILPSWDWKQYSWEQWIVLGTVAVPYIIILIIAITFSWVRKLILSWEQVFVISCIAISLDPFFFYIPIIDRDSKCLGVDYKLRNTLLVLRSVMDFARVVHIVSQIQDWDSYQSDDPDTDTDTDSYFELQQATSRDSRLSRKLNSVVEAIRGRMPWLSGSLMIDFLAVLPIPQVAIVAVFFKIGGSEFFLKTAILNVFLVFQYVPKICQIYLSSKNLDPTGIWVNGAFNFLLYILAGHVLASFWYFFAIQRETSCWHQACKHVTGCIFTYECGSNTPKIISLLNEQCPINSSNTAVFNFGIYLDILQSGNTGSTDFPRKFFYSLWWGIRNLSNFGTNLETSSYVWENCFAILIGLIGLLLFLYLIGNVQTYIHHTTAKSVENAEKAEELRELRKKRIGEKYEEMKKWMSRKGLPEDIKKTMGGQIKQKKFAENYLEVPIDLKFLRKFSYDVRVAVREYLVVNALKKVHMFEKVDEGELKNAAAKARIYVHAKNRCKSMKDVLLVIEGVMELIDTTGSSSKPKLLEKGDYYGEEMLKWMLSTCEPEHKGRPSRSHTFNVKCKTKVEAYIIPESALKILVAYVYNNRGDTSVQNPADTAESLNKTNMHSETIKLEEIDQESKDSKQMEMMNMRSDEGRGKQRESMAVTGASTSGSPVEMMNMRSDEGRGKQRESMAVTGASTSGSPVEQKLEQIIQIIHHADQLHGDITDMLREQHNLTLQIRDDMDTLGRRFDEMAAFIGTLGYPGGIPPPPAP